MVLLVENNQEETQPILKPFLKDSLDVTASYQNSNISAKSIDLKTKEPKAIVDVLSTAVIRNDISSASHCVEVLSKKINKDNALHCLCQLNLKDLNRSFEPSAPPLSPSSPKDTKDNRIEDTVVDFVDNLRNNCLLEIDKNADFVLKHPDLLELNYGDLLNITTRDTLEVSSELVVYCAIMRWGLESQRKKHEEGEELSLRNLLGELIYAPRYGLMSKAEFFTRTIGNIQGPDRSGILREDEIENIRYFIKRKNKSQPVQPLPHKGSLPRKRRNSSGSSSVNPVCEKHLLNFLTCWTAVFD